MPQKNNIMDMLEPDTSTVGFLLNVFTGMGEVLKHSLIFYWIFFHCVHQPAYHQHKENKS